MQIKRHLADYDSQWRWNKEEISDDISTIKTIIDAFENVHLKDRRAFAAYVLLPLRNDQSARIVSTKNRDSSAIDRPNTPRKRT